MPSQERQVGHLCSRGVTFQHAQGTQLLPLLEATGSPEALASEAYVSYSLNSLRGVI